MFEVGGSRLIAAAAAERQQPYTDHLGVGVSKTSIRMRIVLRDVTPEIWRDFTVPSTCALNELHEVLQDVMGWTDSHLHEFFVRGTRLIVAAAGERQQR